MAKNMTRKGKRLTLIIGALAALGVAAGLMLFALRDNIVFFYTPDRARAEAGRPGRAAAHRRAGEGRLASSRAARTVAFAVTDRTKDVDVTYTGLLPDLFREGQGVVAEGTLQTDGSFHADSVLAKHDERYMPREVADGLKKQGVWRDRAPGDECQEDR